MPEVSDLTAQPRFTAKDTVMWSYAGICLTFGLAYFPPVRLVHINPPPIGRLDLSWALWLYGALWLIAGVALVGTSVAGRHRGGALVICASMFFMWGGLFGITALTGLPTAWVGAFLYFLIGTAVAGTSRMGAVPKIARASVERVSEEE